MKFTSITAEYNATTIVEMTLSQIAQKHSLEIDFESAKFSTSEKPVIVISVKTKDKRSIVATISARLIGETILINGSPCPIISVESTTDYEVADLNSSIEIIKNISALN